MGKNDVAWKNLFDEHKILEEVNKKGCFKIKASQINQERESRLLKNIAQILIRNCEI
ncbi:MAG: hypothetical protein WBA93_28425 [Microcoleaceae cyanobacterium]